MTRREHPLAWSSTAYLRPHRRGWLLSEPQTGYSRAIQTVEELRGLRQIVDRLSATPQHLADPRLPDEITALMTDLISGGAIVSRDNAESEWRTKNWVSPAQYFLDYSRALRAPKEWSGDVETLAQEDAEACCASLRARRTCRNFSGEQLPQDVLCMLLRQARALESRHPSSRIGLPLDTTPFSVLCVPLRVAGLAEGRPYVVEPGWRLRSAPLPVEIDEDFVCRGIWGQPMARGTAIAFYVATDLERARSLFPGTTGYGELFISIGALGQRLVAAAARLGLATCMTPALRNSDLDRLIQPSLGTVEVQYYIGVGRPTNGP